VTYSLGVPGTVHSTYSSGLSAQRDRHTVLSRKRIAESRLTMATPEKLVGIAVCEKTHKAVPGTMFSYGWQVSVSQAPGSIQS